MKRGFFLSNKYLNVKDLLVIIGAFVVAALFSAVVVPLAIKDVADNYGKMLFFSYIVNMGLTAVLLLIYRMFRVAKTEGSAPLESPFKVGKFRPSLILWSILLLLSASFVVEPLTSLFPDSSNQIYQFMRESGVWGMVSALFLAPIFEEFIFRGIILTDIRREYRAIMAILASAFIFGVIHGNVVQFFSAFIVGIVLGYVYLKSNSLPLVIFIHFINNTISYTAFKLLPEDVLSKNYAELISSKLLYYSIYGVALLSLLIMLFNIIFFLPRDKKEVAVDEKEEELIDNEQKEGIVANKVE